MQSRYLAPLIVLTVLALWCGCGDDPVTPEPTPTADVNAYMATLPSWDEFSPALPDDDSAAGDPEYNPAHLLENVRYVCKSTPVDITRTPEKILTYTPAPGVLYLGSLIQGDSYAGGVGTFEELPIRQRAPLTILIDNLAFSENDRDVENPNASTVINAIQEMVAIAVSEGLQPSSTVMWDQLEAHSSSQALLKMGLSVKYMSGQASANFSWSRSSEEHTYAAKFIHEMFTTSMVHPQTPSDLFSDDFTKARLDEQIALGRIGPENPPVYVSEITWGRMMVMTMTAKATRTEIQAALDASYNTISTGVEVTGEAALLLEDSETHYTVVALGGDVDGVENLIRTGNLGEYFSADATLTSAVPLSYKLTNLADGSPAKVSETFVYDEVECSPSVQIFHDFYEWEQAANSLGAITRHFDTSYDNVCLCEEHASMIDNMELGPRLTFLAPSPVPEISFLLEAAQGYLTWNDNEGPENQRLISIGDVDNYEEDDFLVEILATQCSDQMVAFGLEIHDNEREAGETIAVYDLDGFQMAHLQGDDIPDGSFRFVGIVSPLPFARFEFDEGIGKDDLFIRDFRFGLRNCP